MAKAKVPVVIISGYLGSGKTTLLKRVIETSGKRIAVVMNEFGEIAVDSEVVRGKSVDMVEILGGCVCCSLTGELEAAIFEILDKVRPEAIVIETTGVAEPDAMVVNMETIEDVKLDSVVTVVDADAAAKFPSMGHTGRVQIECADLVILNKVDLVGQREMEEIVRAISEINPRAKVVRSTYCNVDVGMLFGLDVKRESRAHGAHNVSEIDSFVFRTDRVMDRHRFLKAVSELPKEVYRSKGFVLFGDGPRVFNYVNGRHDFSESSRPGTEIVFIGEGIMGLEGRVLSSMRACEV